jgi:hypothetical protein
MSGTNWIGQLSFAEAADLAFIQREFRTGWRHSTFGNPG